MFTILRNQVLKGLLLAVFLGLLALQLAVPINLTVVDIGRHIKNGELLLQGQTALLYKNFYSFSFPDYPFINHHWFFGVMAYAVHHAAGFKGLSIFYIVLLILAFLLAFDSARRYAGFGAALFFSVLAFLLITSRPEIRPEGISLFMVALDFWLLQRFLQGTLAGPLLWIIPVLQIIWVNTHIFFFMGPLLVGLFWWQAKLEDHSFLDLKFLQRLFVVTLVANLINPSGVGGMLTPLNGLKPFGYALAENQTAFFMIRRFEGNIIYKYYPVIALVLIAGMVLACRRGRAAIPMLLLSLFITLAGFRAVRLFMPFGFLFIPLAAYFYAPYVRYAWGSKAMGFAAAAGVLYLCFWPAHPYIGLAPRVNLSAEFFKGTGLKGPIFSNYDIGGYLIYHLAPQEKVFVDNRQEAFPPGFFQKTYIPMQGDDSIWRKTEAQYGFNVIFFDRHDLTPWGQGFLVKRVRDAEWAPVFVDDYTIIFARRGSIDQPVIDRYELPKSMFKVTVT